MAGIFEMLNSPVAQGILAGGLGAMASRGSRMQALGRGGLLGLSAMGQAQANQENRLVQQAKLQLAQDKANREQQQFEQKQKAIKSLVPDANGAINATPAALIAAELGPEHWAAVLNFGRNKVKEYQDVRMPDGSVQRVGFTEYGDTVNTGATPFSELKVVDFGGNQAAFDPIAGNVRDLGRKTATIAELEAQRHNRASEGIQRGNLEVSRSRLAMEKAQEGNGYTFNAELGGYIPKNPGGDFVPLTGVTTNPKLTESEAKNSLYLGQMREASGVFDKTQSSPIGIAMTNSTLTNWASPQNNQVAAQAQRQWSEAYLRAKTGAAATAQEVDINIRTYFPMPGDSPETVKRKAEARAAAERDMELTAGRGASRVSGSKPSTEPAKPNRQIIRTGTLNGRKVVQYSDGSTAYAD